MINSKEREVLDFIADAYISAVDKYRVNLDRLPKKEDLIGMVVDLTGLSKSEVLNLFYKVTISSYYKRKFEENGLVPRPGFIEPSKEVKRERERMQFNIQNYQSGRYKTF